MNSVIHLLATLTVNIVGSLIGVGLWFHFDLEDYYQERKHRRMVRRGERLDRRDRVRP